MEKLDSTAETTAVKAGWRNIAKRGIYRLDAQIENGNATINVASYELSKKIEGRI